MAFEFLKEKISKNRDIPLDAWIQPVTSFVPTLPSYQTSERSAHP